MTVHEQFADDLSLHALGMLQAEERAALEQHLHECAACQRELQQLRGDMAYLALSASGPKPPQRSRQRLMAAIAQEPRGVAVPKRRGAWWPVLEWVAAAAAVAIVALLLKQNSDLKQHMTAMKSEFVQQQQQLEQTNRVVATFTAPESQQVTLVAAKAPPQPQGKAFYLRNRGGLVFLATNMPAPPAQKAYELWIIPTSGAPIRAGVFKPNAHGSAAVVNPPIPTGVEAKAFAITVEPEAGVDAPTTKPIMVGAAGE
jgi:anti-sigma-K factor RskA